MKWIFSFLLLSLTITAFAQQSKSDINLIAQQSLQNLEILNANTPHHSTIKFHSKNYLLTYNPRSLFFKGSLFFYQRLISPQISADCLYKTSCSNFSKQSIQRFGLVKGLLLTSDRLMRCNRIGALDISIATIDETTGKAIDLPETYSFRKK
jgi:putative component of membrane protein insertase Oxa1/YidC/SpoIIIJ protein YidD